jgi:hypothetical protein
MRDEVWCWGMSVKAWRIWLSLDCPSDWIHSFFCGDVDPIDFQSKVFSDLTRNCSREKVNLMNINSLINCKVANIAQTEDKELIGVSAASWEQACNRYNRKLYGDYYINLAKKRAELLRYRERELLSEGEQPYQFESMY